VESKWKELSNGAPFDYYFLDEEFNRIYRAEKRMSEVFALFTFLAIIIACLGLFGLATFTAEQKTKEIGIRKALGASLPNIVYTLTHNFMKLVGVAILISMPVSYYIMNDWLQGFAYKTTFGIWIFAGTAILVMGVALATVSYQAISVGINKPSDALRAE
jgi:putative ABC transport system permease protein